MNAVEDLPTADRREERQLRLCVSSHVKLLVLADSCTRSNGQCANCRQMPPCASKIDFDDYLNKLLEATRQAKKDQKSENAISQEESSASLISENKENLPESFNDVSKPALKPPKPSSDSPKTPPNAARAPIIRDCLNDSDLFSVPHTNLVHSTAKKRPVFAKPVFTKLDILDDISVDDSTLVTSTAKKASLESKSAVARLITEPKRDPLKDQSSKKTPTSTDADKSPADDEPKKQPVDSDGFATPRKKPAFLQLENSLPEPGELEHSQLVTSTAKKSSVGQKSAAARSIIECGTGEQQERPPKITKVDSGNNLEPGFKQIPVVKIEAPKIEPKSVGEDKKPKVIAGQQQKKPALKLDTDKKLNDALKRKEALLKEKQKKMKEANRAKLENAKLNREKQQQQDKQQQQQQKNFIGNTLSKIKNFIPSFGGSKSDSAQQTDKKEYINRACEDSEGDFQKLYKDRRIDRNKIFEMAQAQYLEYNVKCKKMMSITSTLPIKRLIEEGDPKQRVINRNNETMF